jgi:hypothetical protein
MASTTQLVDFEKQEDGSLRISLIESERGEVEALRDMPTADALAELFEYQTSNGWEWIRPEETGDLTDAPMITDHVDRDDQGSIVKIAHVWFDNNYMVRDPIDHLLRDGSIVFDYHSYI